MHLLPSSLVRAIGCAAVVAIATAFSANADVIADWNAKAEAIAVKKKMLPPPNARGMAIMHAAMFEAVNAVERRYAPYRLNLTAGRNVSKEAAAAAAAHSVLIALHPDEQEAINAALAAALAAIPDSDSKAAGVALGKKAGLEMLVLRAKDGATVSETYRPYTIAGVYVPTVVPVSSTFGSVTPWVMKSGSQFRPAPPPALSSATWARDVNEIREFGGRSSKRSPEQTDIGMFWYVTGPQAWNPIVRQLATVKQLDIVDSARLFALVAMATNDAFIAVFDAKYHYNFWRPVTAIRNADLSDNPAAQRDAGWLPMGDTPMHPEYPCAHCITSAAAATVLQAAFGNDVPEVSMTSVTAPGVTRRWKRLQDYSDEVSVARIYAGFHYRFSTVVGQEMGRQIAELALRTQLRAPGAAAAPSR